MVSRTSLTEQVKAFDVDGVLAGLDARPELLRVRDDKGRHALDLAVVGGTEEPLEDAQEQGPVDAGRRRRPCLALRLPRKIALFRARET
jgi:hypothetical protein